MEPNKIKYFIDRYRRLQLVSSGMKVVFAKELGDNIRSSRFGILIAIVAVAGIGAFYIAAQTIRQTVGQGSFVFLHLFTTSGNSLPPFITFMSFLGPLLGLALGFDAINGEYNRRTLSRLLAQPIYRDDVINGKFLSGLAVLSLVMFALGLLVAGLGLLLIGIPPTAGEIVRLFVYFVATIIYIAFWLSVSLLFSILFRQAATSALAGIAVWLFFALFAGMLAQLVAGGIFPVTNNSSAAQLMNHAALQEHLAQVSPTTLYDQITTTILDPGVRTLGPVLVEQVAGAVPGSLPLGQSLLLVWPQFVSLVAATMIIFALAYYNFMRREIRAD